MQEIAKYLKSAREKQNLSLEDVAGRTKIHIHKLRAIEEWNLDLLPAKVFCIGLIKSFAREVKADLNKVDELCNQAFHEPEVPAANLSIEKPKNEKDDSSETQPVGLFQVPKVVAYAASGVLSLVLLFTIYFVIEKMNSYSLEEELPEEVYTNIRRDKDQNKADEEAKQATNKESIETESDQLVAENQENNTDVAAAQQSPQRPNSLGVSLAKKHPVESAPEIPSESQIDKVPQKTSDFKDDNDFDEPLNNENSVVISDNKLVVIALEPVRAEVVWSDGYVQVMLLKGQETKTLVFSTPIKLRVNNGGAVQVSFNDGEKKVPGPFNQPIELDYP